ncbi:hypothetical protein [[Clostridium] polysaccharolyticum]|uniref:Uncharacterized protein n=1 Tax=[Clostridium] polysaccharolyticum TaxID=29364 RepID=A0A1I0AES6_9FIRM|nr:hypothetical protein [[Clostridium] polysaccharolyticum]SES92750.1 hypothetical protein SAMN04487772_105122 [[Clostridium] polysaccharolyticum]
MKKRKSMVLLILILCVGIYIYNSSLTTKGIAVKNLRQYCKKHSSCSAKDYFIEHIANYYFAVSTNGVRDKSDELMILSQCKNRNIYKRKGRMLCRIIFIYMARYLQLEVMC